jgi:hypothetical protein
VAVAPQQTVHSLEYTCDTPRVPAVFETSSSHAIGYESLRSKYVYCVLYRAVCRLDITRIGHETERKAGSVWRGSEHRGTQKRTSQRFVSDCRRKGWDGGQDGACSFAYFEMFVACTLRQYLRVYTRGGKAFARL